MNTQLSTAMTLDLNALATVHGGLIAPIPGGGGGTARPPIHLTGPITQLGKDKNKPAKCETWKTWNSPQGIGILAGGGLTRVPLLSCPRLKVPR